jgi:mRNA interferase RelE/StbE
LTWRIELGTRAKKELAALDSRVASRIAKFLVKRVAMLDDPRSIGDALKGPELGKYWKYRVGDDRVICALEDAIVRVFVVRIAHRRDVYR